MTWPNVIAVTDGKSALIVEEYGIRSIPTNFLISPEGKIVAKDLRGEGIKEKARRTGQISASGKIIELPLRISARRGNFCMTNLRSP